MRPIAILPLLLLGACAAERVTAAQVASRCEGYETEAKASTHPGIAARHAQEARDCWAALHRGVRRQRIARDYAASEPFPVIVPYAVPVVSYIADPAPIAPVPPPAGNTEPRMLDIVMPQPYQPQTWGQTRCAPAIAPVMWDEPTSTRNPLIPAAC